MALDGARVAVQGFGNVGGWAAILCHRMGMKVVAVGDVSGGFYDPDGLDIPALNEHVQRNPRHLIEGYTAAGLYLLGYVDPSNTIAETNEDNNLANGGVLR